MEEIVSAITTTIFDNSLRVIGRQFGYLWNYRKNVDRLRDQVQKLDAKRNDQSYSVTVAQKNAETIRSEVVKWQNKAEKISEDARKFIEECEEKRMKRCLMGLCPNPVSRYRSSRRSCKKKVEIEETMTEAEQIIKVSDPAIGMGKEIALSTKGLFSFASRKSILEDIMEALQDETTKSIGVYGFGGMGKTTLAKQVAARAGEDKMFEEIVFAAVTQTVDLKKIQEKIASMLDLNLKDSTEAQNAGRTHARLKGKKVLIVLDDLWEKLDLNDLGILIGTEHMGCKILLTSRYRHVLSSMGTEKDFLLGALEEEEAWRLFEEKTGSVLKNSDFYNIGKEVAKRCQGLPVLIVTIATSLSRRPQLPAWNDALNQLRKMNNKEMHDIVNSAIESISYNHLEKTHKRLFLLCGVIGGDASVEKLFQYSLGWDLFDEEFVTIEEARNRLHTLILDLKEFCLLLDDQNIKSIKKHDVVRDVAVSIAKKDLNMFSIKENDVDIWHTDNLKSCTAMVYSGCSERAPLPDQLECPLLELCILTGSRGMESLEIPYFFFEKTSKLKVLSMSQFFAVELPSSLSCLTNLQTLRVEGCRMLSDISIRGNLKKLQILSFSGSGIVELPSEVGQLSELRLLDTRGCYKLQGIPPGLIQTLSQLEELYIDRNFSGWERENGPLSYSTVESNASLVELKHLPNLCSLEITVQDIKLLPEDLIFKKFERYKIVVGGKWNLWVIVNWLNSPEITRNICVEFSTRTTNHLQHGIKSLFKRAECLCLGELYGVKNVAPELDENGFSDLKHLFIEKDYESQYIVNVEDKQPASFRSLKSLHLINMLKLQKICNGRLIKESFSSLIHVVVVGCNKLESLFSFSMVTELRCLEEIKVSNCDALEEIVAKKNREDDDANINDVVCEKIEFVQVRKLSLKCLPKLMTFSNGEMLPVQTKNQKYLRTGVESEEIHAEEEKFISSMPFFKKIQFPELKELNISHFDSINSIWPNKQLYQVNSFGKLEQVNLRKEPQKVPSFQILSKVTVMRCSTLIHVFPAYVAQSLNQLEVLIVEGCEAVETIIADENEEESSEIIKEVAATFVFPKLTTLYLKSLPKLKCFYPREHTIQCPALKELDLFRCDKLYHMDFISIPEKQGDIQFKEVILKLKNLSIRSMELMKIMTLYDPFPSYLFRDLESLAIAEFSSESDALSELFSMIHNQLETFRVYNCSFQNIFSYEGEAAIYVRDKFFLFQLCGLDLEKLPDLKCICKLGQYSIMTTILDRLVWLIVNECSRLTNLVPSSASFSRLTNLFISNCGELVNLIEPSTARSLKCLQELSVSGCEMIEGIIGGEVSGDDVGSSRDDNEIIFSKLICLQLKELPRLTSFCSFRNFILHFPILDRVILTECPNMKTFSEGTITTPELNAVVHGDKAYWDGDLNTTVQISFAEMEAKRLATATTLHQPHLVTMLKQNLKSTRAHLRNSPSQKWKPSFVRMPPIPKKELRFVIKVEENS